MNEQLLTVTDLGNRWQKPPQAVYWMRSRGQGPPAVKVGKELRFRLSDVVSWEDAQAAADRRSG